MVVIQHSSHILGCLSVSLLTGKNLTPFPVPLLKYTKAFDTSSFVLSTPILITHGTENSVGSQQNKACAVQ